MKFWQELRRRRVYRLAGVYIVGAWLVIQVAEMLFQAWGVPESVLQYLFLAAAACFPVALRNSVDSPAQISAILGVRYLLQELSAGRTTTNMDAYNEYLVCKSFINSRVYGWEEKAAAACRRAIALDAGFAPPYAALAFVMPEDKHNDAQRLVQQALELDPLLAEGHAVAGVLQLDKDDAAAEKSLRRALELDPALGNAYNWLGNALMNQDRDAEATAIYDKGLEIDPLNPPMAINVAINLSTLGDFDRAEKLLLRLAYLPEPPNLIYYNLRSFYRQWGRLDKAIYWWQEGLRAVQGKLVAGGRNNNWLGLASLHHGEAYAMLGLFEEERPGLA